MVVVALVTVKDCAEASPRLDVAVAVMEVNIGLAESVICVDVPISTFCPPLIFKLEPTVKEANVEVPVPPRATESCPLQPKVKTWFKIDPVMFVSFTVPCTTLGFSRSAASVPVKYGVKVWTPLAEEIFKPMLVSLPVAKVCTGLVRPFKEVIALAAIAQEAHSRPLAEVDEAIKHNPLLPTAWMPSVPLPVPAIRPPLEIAEASKPRPPDAKASGWVKFRLAIVAVAKVEVPKTSIVPATAKVEFGVFVPIPSRVVDAS